MSCDGVIRCLEEIKIPIQIKDRHTCLDLNDRDMYILKRGIVKVSLIMQDEREFNITYLQGPDVVSLYCDCLTQFRDCHPKIRVESEQAEFYCISKDKFYKRAKEDAKLQHYVNTYYRKRLKLAVTREQVMIMNSKAGAVCSWLYRLASLFGIQTQKGIFIDLQVTNEDIANFCGITTRNSVNRVIRGLKEKNVIQVINNRIIVLDMDYLKQFTE
ncbi:Crp/Fnr family transcriptional regulator [uncultured Holdemanella sp.]|uniref:Crp/Fnr family transcriptional regulator n=1 Tax=uncultured Holdemanella sp. TaxID=1763549 RepID=UPI0025D44CB4|nr:Crp/Fnr family transcriptional regulator [uncultured Holdemanella sp.]